MLLPKYYTDESNNERKRQLEVFDEILANLWGNVISLHRDIASNGDCLKYVSLANIFANLNSTYGFPCVTLI